MSFTDIFIRRPVLSSVVSLLILLIGLSAAFNLPVRQYPELSNTTITITTVYPGANADVIKGFITVPIQQAVASAEGIDTLTSSSRQNVSTVTLNLRLNADPDRAVTDVLSKVNQVQSILPREAQDPVVVKQTGESTALMYLSFNSDVLTSSQITDYLTRVVQPKLQTDRRRRQRADPRRADVRHAHLAQPAEDGGARRHADGGAHRARRQQLHLRRRPDQGRLRPDDDQRRDLARQRRGLRPARRRGARRRARAPRDIAEIALGAENVDSSSVFNGLKAVFIGIYSTPTANPLTVIADVRKTFPEIQRSCRPAWTRRSPTIRPSSSTPRSRRCRRRCSRRPLIVIVVIFLFLGSLRSTLIPIVTIPLSLIGVMFALLALGYSLNLLTLLALVLAIGLVVDDAIVVVENIHRHIEEGMSPFDAALAGRARDRRAGHLDDDHARRGLCADRLRLRPHRRAVPRVRLHARRRGRSSPASSR